MSKDLEYKALEDDSVLDLSAALNQASMLLDIAGIEAINSGDVKNMIKVAEKWIKIGELLSPDQEDNIDTTNSVPFGFSMDRDEVKNGEQCEQRDTNN